MTTGLLLPHEQRMIEEKEQLNEKIEKLQAFLENKAPLIGMEPYDLNLLRHQLRTMFSYSEVLGMRISRFDHAPAEG
jgi:hypothetical protein